MAEAKDGDNLELQKRFKYAHKVLTGNNGPASPETGSISPKVKR